MIRVRIRTLDRLRNKITGLLTDNHTIVFLPALSARDLIGVNAYLTRNVCYRCGQFGHYASRRRAMPIEVVEQVNKGKVRIFTITHDEAAQNPDVITSI